MIQFSAAGKRYGHKLLFENADWLITPESRIGLVGACLLFTSDAADE